MAPELLSAKGNRRVSHACSRVNTTYKQAAGGRRLTAQLQDI